MDRLAYLVYRLASAITGWVPLSVVCRFGKIAGLCAYYLLPQYRRLALRNLEIAFGTEMSASERRSLARRHFATLGGNLLGSIGVAGMNADQVRAVGEVEGDEIPRRLLAEGKGIVFVIAHLGNWEFLSQITPLVLQGSLGTIYQRLGNPYIDAEVRTIRARLGLHVFERKEGFQGAVKLVRAGGGVGVLADQHAGDGGVWAPFFGRLASSSSLPAMLALRSGATIVPTEVLTLGPGRWRMIFREPIPTQGRSADQLTADINLSLEKSIRRAPEEWFWVHNRWKTPRPKFLLSTYKRGMVAPVDGRPLQPFRILIRSTNWLGDAVMSVPAVRAIKAGRPDAHLTILAPAKLAQIWSAVAEVDEVVPIEPGENIFAVAGKIRGRFEAVILFPNSLRAGLEAWMAGIPRRVGFPGHRRSWLLNQVLRDKKAKVGAPVHQVEHYLRLAKFVGAETAKSRSPVGTSRFAKGADRARIGVCPGAEYGAAKRWPADSFAGVIQEVAASTAAEWVIFGVEKDATIAEEIAAKCSVTLENRVGKTGVRELMQELAGCDLLLTNDTGTMHLAALLGVPVVAIFGSTEPALTGPLGPQHRVLRHHVECSPCFLRECPLDFRCMSAVETKEAVQAIRELLAVKATAREHAGRPSDVPG